MIRYTIADRIWTTGPAGVPISVIPGREIVHTIDPLPPPPPAKPAPTKPPTVAGVTRDYIIAYLTEHGSATAAQMVPADKRITRSAIATCLSTRSDLFVQIRRHRPASEPGIWRLRRQS